MRHRQIRLRSFVPLFSQTNQRFRANRRTALLVSLVLITGVAGLSGTSKPATASAREPVAVTDQWSETAQIYRNADQSLSATIGAGPIQEPDPESPTGWSPIDTTLVLAEGGVQPRLIDGELTFSAGAARCRRPDPVQVMSRGQPPPPTSEPGRLSRPGCHTCRSEPAFPPR